MTKTSSDQTPAIDIRDLRVDYGDFVAVDDLSLQVPAGEVFGLVGPNGAGKTSTFKVLATLMEPTYGEVRLAGVDVLESPEKAREVIGYMPDLAPVPSDLKIWEFLDYYCRVHAIGTRAERRARWEECLETVNLTGKRDAWCKKLSRGQTQRLVLAKTLLHRPRVMILDEPASGLDPLSRRDLRFALRRLAEDGVTVFISSHILGELAEMCSSLCVMNLGKILASGTADEVRASMGRSERGLKAVVLGDVGEAVGWLESEEGVHDVRVGEGEVAFGYRGTDEGQAGLLAGMIERGARVRSFEESGSSFEDILVDVAEGNRKEGIHV